MDADWDDGPLCEFDDDHFDYHSKCECGHAAIDHEGCPCRCIIRYCFECGCKTFHLADTHTQKTKWQRNY